MIKTITKIGNSQGIIFDNTLMQLAHLKVGDQVNVEVHNGRTVTIESISTLPDEHFIDTMILDTMKDYATTMKNLA